MLLLLVIQVNTAEYNMCVSSDTSTHTTPYFRLTSLNSFTYTATTSCFYIRLNKRVKPTTTSWPPFKINVSGVVNYDLVYSESDTVVLSPGTNIPTGGDIRTGYIYIPITPGTITITLINLDDLTPIYGGSYNVGWLHFGDYNFPQCLAFTSGTAIRPGDNAIFKIQENTPITINPITVSSISSPVDVNPHVVTSITNPVAISSIASAIVVDHITNNIKLSSASDPISISNIIGQVAVSTIVNPITVNPLVVSSITAPININPITMTDAIILNTSPSSIIRLITTTTGCALWNGSGYNTALGISILTKSQVNFLIAIKTVYTYTGITKLIFTSDTDASNKLEIMISNNKIYVNGALKNDLYYFSMYNLTNGAVTIAIQQMDTLTSALGILFAILNYS